MKRKFVTLAIVALVAGALGLAVGLKKHEASPAESTAVANLLNQSMTNLQGNPESLSKWKGKALVVNFWATWCEPCVEEMPELSALQAQLQPRNIHILGIGIDSLDNVARFAEKYKIAYPLYIGGMSGSELSRQLGNKAGGLPFTVLVGSDGKVRKTYLGRLKMQELRQDLESL
ncbi:TlpA disulfide reductase family protein [Noviherbaspirillum massiliense]|uniref:TlpA disulfide reductase family protein n=1 Tax=Noviherbaspirillum massiliense TaxID=1465823 RepID=UPI0002FB1AA7|nr:TlpA disulfide reductase family protein [Noviherbaspirillum massiliense]